jgi:serine/threonine-protein kinase
LRFSQREGGTVDGERAAAPREGLRTELRGEVGGDLRAELQRALGSTHTIERELGGGGMARIFAAEETALGRTVVVKVLRPELAEGLSAERFKREVRLAARLQHPHIVPLLTAGELPGGAGLLYYTMPFVAGETLRARLDREGAVSVPEAARLLGDVASALAYAHRRGVVHRDVKPENVLLSEGGALVVDFGIAKAIARAISEAQAGVTTAASGAEGAGEPAGPRAPREAPEPNETDAGESGAGGEGGDARRLGGHPHLTQHGTSLGTPAYMAPEQIAGDPDVDARADLYAWGVVAYELLAGAHPFADRRSSQALLVAHLTESPPPLAVRCPEAPAPLAALVARCLAKDPADRPADGTAVARELDALRFGGGDRAPAAPAEGPPVRPGRGGMLPSVAVLPFENLSADPENEFLSDGVTEDIIGALTRVPGLRVAARASSFAFKGRDASLRAIGEQLGVRTVLQGSVRRAGNRVRVSTQLMSARDGYQLWSERFDRELDDLFAVQDEIARRVAEHLELTLGLSPSSPLVARPTDDLEAYQLYLRAREAVHQRTPVSFERAVKLLRQALARDPNYARAHLGLVEAYVGLGVYEYIPPAEARREAETALEAAARADPELPALPLMRAQLKLYLRPDWPSAGSDLRKAIRRQPQEALAHAYLAYWSSLMGDRPGRSAAMRQALALDPLSPFVHALAGLSCLVAGDLAEALGLYDAGLALDPNSVVNLWQSAVALHRLGRLDEAIRRHARAVELGQRGPTLLAMLGHALAAAGREDEARAIRAEIEAAAARTYVGPAVTLGLDIALGDEALIEETLRRSIRVGTGPTTLSAALVGDLARLRTHPRLGPLADRLSLLAKRPG